MTSDERLPDVLEAELRSRQDAQPPAGVLDNVRTAIRSTPQRRPTAVRAGWAIAAAVVLMTTVAGGALVRSFSTPTGTSPPTSPAGPTVSGWQPMAPSPLSARHAANAFWTGSEVLILGGDAVKPPCPGECFWDAQLLRDGAAYDPRSDSWRRIQPAPVALGTVSGAIVDDALYLLASTSNDSSVFLRFRIRADAWDELPPPTGASPGLALVAAGNRVIAYQGTEEHGVLPIQAFDVTSSRWSTLPADPLTPAYDRTLIWTGQDLVLIGIRLDPARPPDRPSVYSAAVLASGASTWRRLADSEISGWDPSWHWAAGRIINPATGHGDGGQINNWGRTYPFGGILTPGTWVWSTLPDPPAGFGAYQGLTVGGPEHVVAFNGWVLHVPTGRWVELTKPPSEPIGEAVTWAGDRLLVWGGIHWEPARSAALDPVGTLLNVGALWSP